MEAPTAHYDASAEFMGIGVLSLASYFWHLTNQPILFTFPCKVSAGITANIADFGIYIDAEVGES